MDAAQGREDGKMTVYVLNLEGLDRVNGIYTRYFPEPQPARSGVGANLRIGRLVETDAVAAPGTVESSSLTR